MQVFDASSMIYAWDNYPVRQFPGLWRWMANQIQIQRIVMPKVAFQEVKAKIPECADWLEQKSIRRIEMTNAILREALRIKDLLGIEGDEYHPKGIGENDLFIIATSRILESELISNEARQNIPPNKHSKMKIPAVCALSGIGITCYNFIEFIKNSDEVFG